MHSEQQQGLTQLMGWPDFSRRRWRVLIIMLAVRLGFAPKSPLGCMEGCIAARMSEAGKLLARNFWLIPATQNGKHLQSGSDATDFQRADIQCKQF
jgi:hypothetical protein